MTAVDDRIPFPLPLELRAGLEAIVEAQHGRVSGRVIGDLELTRILLEFAPSQDDGKTLISLLASEREILDDLGLSRRSCVVSLHTASLYPITDRFRRFHLKLAPDRPQSAWKTDGFRQESRIGIQGPGSLFWMMSGRVARMTRREDWFDRCRFNERRTVRTTAPLSPVATYGLTTYRSTR